jgi:hypothetical protein
MKDAYDKMKNDFDAAEDKAMTEKCTNMVTAFATAGKIKNDAATIAKWVNRAKADFDGIKNDLDELPVNKTAEKLDSKEAEKVVNSKGAYLASNVMAGIAAKQALKK